MSQIQVCLKCARQESDRHRSTCQCGGTLWHPQNVGGKPGNTDLDEAIRLIRAGKTPWQKS
jgi:hypothetical protein